MASLTSEIELDLELEAKDENQLNSNVLSLNMSLSNDLGSVDISDISLDLTLLNEQDNN